MNRTRIPWPWDNLHTANPIIGCAPISEGCAHCYARTMAKRLAAMGVAFYDKVQAWDGRVVFKPEVLWQVNARNKSCAIFWCSMSDLFGASVQHEWIARVFNMMAMTPHHAHIILTKRPERMAAFLEDWPLLTPNIWLGVTAENQARADERIPILLSIKGNHRTFVSVEPMLGPVSLRPHLHGIHQVICGPETGPGARPYHVGWNAALYEECKAAGVPYYDKTLKHQFGGEQ